MIGEKLGPFLLLGRLGSGGMGEVFAAEDPQLKRRVAIKTLPKTFGTEPERVARFRREAEALAALNHPNVVTVHAVGEQDGQPFLVMELVEGETLAHMIPEGGLDGREVLALGLQLAEALGAAHQAGVLHRDLKPSNVMVTRDGRVKVVDFGLARLDAPGSPDVGEPLTGSGVALGTVPYMAPEQLRGESVDATADVHALGATLFHLATGRLPFLGVSMMDVAAAILRETPPRLRSLRADASPRLEALVADCLAKQPAARPRNGTAVLERLRASEGLDEGPPPAESAATEAIPTVALRAAPQSSPSTGIERLLLRGRNLCNKRTEAGFREALVCFQDALDLEPDAPRAWVGVADCFNMLANYGFVEPAQSHRRALAAAEKALALDAGAADAHRALALARFQFEFDWAGAEAAYRQAIRCDPRTPLGHYWLGILLGVTARFDEALHELAEAEALDPLMLHATAARGWVLTFAQRFGEAAAVLRSVRSLDANFFVVHWYLGQALGELGEVAESRAALERALELSGGLPRILAYSGFAAGRQGDRQAARAALDELEQRARTGYVPPYFRALVWSGLGEDDLALRELEQALETRDAMLRDIKVDPSWRRLRGAPRYRALLEALGLGAVLPP